MYNSFSISLLKLKDIVKDISENNGVIGVSIGTDGRLRIQMNDISGLNYLSDVEDCEITQEHYEYDGKPWVRTSCIWHDIKVFHVTPVEGGEQKNV